MKENCFININRCASGTTHFSCPGQILVMCRPPWMQRYWSSWLTFDLQSHPEWENITEDNWLTQRLYGKKMMWLKILTSESELSSSDRVGAWSLFLWKPPEPFCWSDMPLANDSVLEAFLAPSEEDISVQNSTEQLHKEQKEIQRKLSVFYTKRQK